MKASPPSLQVVERALWFDTLIWATICPSPQIPSPSPQSRVPDPCHSARNETESYQDENPLWRNVWSLSALIKLLKESLHTYQRGKGIMMITCSILQRKIEQRWNAVCAKSDKKSWLISIQKSAFISIQLNPIKHLLCARFCIGSFCFCRGRRCCFLDFFGWANNSFAIKQMNKVSLVCTGPP